MRRDFPVHPSQTRAEAPPARRCARPFASIRCAHHRETTFTHQPVNPIVIIPARMASTRLPGKPLADIHGRPMIVHVLDRGREADLGPVAVACGDAVIADAVRAAGGRAVLTDPALPSGSDRVFAALAELDPEGRHDVVVNLQGDFPTITAAQLRLVVAPLADPACRHRHAGGADRLGDRGQHRVVRQGRVRVRRGRRPSRRRCISRASRSRGATGRAGTTSASMPTAGRRLPATSRCRPRRWSGGRTWSNCGRWRQACASAARAWSTGRSASIRRRTWNGRAALLAPAGRA